MGVGENIRTLRILNGMTQEVLAEKMGYKNKASINKIEKGVNSISAEKMQKFADVLHTSVAILMGETEDLIDFYRPHIQGSIVPRVNQANMEKALKDKELDDTYAELFQIISEINSDGMKRLIAYAEDIQDKYRREDK